MTTRPNGEPCDDEATGTSGGNQTLAERRPAAER